MRHTAAAFLVGAFLSLLTSACAPKPPATAQTGAASPSQPAPAAGETNASPAADAEFERQMTQLQENADKMRTQMGEIRATKDPAQRQRLMQEHMATMQMAMTTMRGMTGTEGMTCCGSAPMGQPGQGNHMMNGQMMSQGMGPGMKPGGMMGGGMMMTPDQMQQRHRMMEQMIGMQQMMMENMLQHQQQLESK